MAEARISKKSAKAKSRAGQFEKWMSTRPVITQEYLSEILKLQNEHDRLAILLNEAQKAVIAATKAEEMIDKASYELLLAFDEIQKNALLMMRARAIHQLV